MKLGQFYSFTLIIILCFINVKSQMIRECPVGELFTVFIADASDPCSYHMCYDFGDRVVMRRCSKGTGVSPNHFSVFNPCSLPMPQCDELPVEPTTTLSTSPPLSSKTTTASTTNASTSHSVTASTTRLPTTTRYHTTTRLPTTTRYHTTTRPPTTTRYHTTTRHHSSTTHDHTTRYPTTTRLTPTSPSINSTAPPTPTRTGFPSTSRLSTHSTTTTASTPTTTVVQQPSTQPTTPGVPVPGSSRTNNSATVSPSPIATSTTPGGVSPTVSPSVMSNMGVGLVTPNERRLNGIALLGINDIVTCIQNCVNPCSGVTFNLTSTRCLLHFLPFECGPAIIDSCCVHYRPFSTQCPSSG